jgi:hypothetical protein
MHHHHSHTLAHIILTVPTSLFLWLVVREWWPWDWRGRRKDIKLNTRQNDWDDD